MPTPPPLDPARHALFLDFDGTLVDLQDDPDAVALAPEELKILRRLAERMGGAFAIVSGRRIIDLDRFLAPLEFSAIGVHGLERRQKHGDPVERIEGPEILDDVRDKLAPLIEANPRIRLEDKGVALVLHYRTAPDLAEACHAAMRRATAGRDDLRVMAGDNIVEVHPSGMDKGVALVAMMKDAPYAGRVPVYLGDDTTDEYALKRVVEAKGLAIKVGDKPSAAEYRLDGVASVHRWLAAGLT